MEASDTQEASQTSSATASNGGVRPSMGNEGNNRAESSEGQPILSNDEKSHQPF